MCLKMLFTNSDKCTGKQIILKKKPYKILGYHTKEEKKSK